MGFPARLCAAIALVTLVTGACNSAPLVLEDSRILVEVSPGNGAITRIVDRPSDTTLAPDHASAENFRLVLVKPDKTTVTILGKDQKLSNFASEHGMIRLRWDGPLKDTAGAEFKINVRMGIHASGGKLEFTLGLDNGTEDKLQEAWYPLIGGLQKLGADASVWVPTSNPWQKPIKAPVGANAFGYPGQMNMSFVCVQSKSAGRSIYLASEDEIARYKVYHLMGLPGKDGEDAFACIHHVPLTPPGKSFSGTQVVLRFVEGDWRAAGKVYRDFFKNAFGLADPKTDWIRRQSFFLMTMFELPEGTINYTFKDIPRWAKAAKDHGVNAVQISGWQVGGHDNGYPCYTPDPRLGTWKELENGILACHKMGLKVFFFVNYQPMMLESEWYKNELHKYREWNPDGGLTWNTGWGMGTLWARMGHAKLETWADLGFPQFRKIIVDQFAKLASIGADGVHVDKMFPSAIDYNPDIPMSPDRSTWEGAILLSEEIFAACRKHNPNWAMSFECNWDRMLQFGRCTWWVGNQLVTRSVFPENAETLAITNAYDYLGVNNAVRNGHHVMLAPMSFARGMDWAPFAGLNDYIRDVKLIQDKLQETVFLGEALGRDGVTISGQLRQGVDCNVFRNRDTGHRVCILTNSSLETCSQVVKGFAGAKSPSVRVYLPSLKSYVVNLPAAIGVPAERIVFVEELARKTKITAHGVPSSPQTIKLSERKSSFPNGDFESGGFDGWTADPNWVIAKDSRGYYSGWQGKYWAWSGSTGEAAVGKLTSKPFKLEKDGVRLLISGWNSVNGTGSPRKWNYVTLNLTDGTEIDRVYAPNTTAFVSAFLDGSTHKGKMVYLRAVDDADQPTFSMLCIDDVRTADLPPDQTKPAPRLARFDPKRSVKLEDENLLLVVSRVNGSLTRAHDKKTGLELILEPRLAGSWKFALPIPGKEPWQTIEANWIIGRQQKLASLDLQGTKLTLRWAGPLTNYLGEKYDASVSETIELTAGGTLLNLKIDNRTPYQVGETYFPIIGGIQGLGTTRGQLKSTEFARPLAGGSVATSDIFRTFANMSSFGDQGPEQFYAYPEAQPEPWIEFHSSKLGRSVYVGAHDPSDRKKVVRMELVPSGSGTAREDGNWPRQDELKGMPVGVELSFVDCFGSAVGKDYEAAPVFVRFHDGDLHESRKVYEAWNAGK